MTESPLPNDNVASDTVEADAAAAASRRAGRKRRVRRILLLAGPLLALAAGGYFYVTAGRHVGTEDAYVKADMVMISAEVSGKLTEVDVAENQHVEAGDVLFRIDDRTYRIALAQAEAQLANVGADIAALKASYRQAQEQSALDRANIVYAQKELKRQTDLLASSVTSRARFDSASHDVDVARQKLRVDEQTLAQIRAQLGGDPDIETTRHPRYLAAKAARDHAALDLERTVVRAPFAGIASNTPDPGQQVVGSSMMASPVMSIVADTGAWVVANFKETDLTHVRPGQHVAIGFDTYPDHEWQGTVQSISQATGAEFSVIPAQNASGNWVKVVQRIPVRIAIERQQDGPPLRVGMSASIDIDTHWQRPLPGFVRTAFSWFGQPTVAQAATVDARH